MAARPGAVLLLDSQPLTPYLRYFLSAYRPDRVIPVGAFPDGKSELDAGSASVWMRPLPGPPARLRDLWPILFPTAPCLVVSPARPRARLLRAACLAGAMRAPLWISGNQPAETAILDRWLTHWNTWPLVVVSPAGSIALPSRSPGEAWCG